MKKCIHIDGRSIGGDNPPYVIAEVSANHGGSLEAALKVMDAASNAGAHAIKLQTYTADTLTIDHDGPDFTIKDGLWKGRKLYDLYQEAHTPWEWHPTLFQRGRELGVTVFSTPFDASAVDFLEGLGAPAYKIASFELVDLPLIRRVAATGKPTIMSTGMATMLDINDAVSAFHECGGRELALLHCVSGYPTPLEQSNLRRIPALAEAYGAPVGLSDHTLGTEAALAAVALGASLIEKHFTLRRADGGPDSAFSLEPAELAALVSGTNAVFRALGSGSEDRSTAEMGSLVFRRSLYVVSDIEAGEVITQDNVRIIRPGFGLPPKHLPGVLGKRASKCLRRGEALTWDAIQID